MLGKSPHHTWPWRRSIMLALVATLLSAGLFVSTASATVMKYADLETLIEISDFIAHGQVVEQQTYFDKEQQRVVTDTTIAIERTFWGELDEKVTFQQWRGEYNDQFHSIPGDANFASGEEVIVFLHQGDDGTIALSALGQAKFAVETTGDGKLVSRDLSDITFWIDRGDADTRGPVAGGAPDQGGYLQHLPGETRSFESFTAELEAQVAGIKGGDHE